MELFQLKNYRLQFFGIIYIWMILIAVGVSSPVCDLEAKCVNSTGEVCPYDDVDNCIRKYKSKCHMDIGACNLRRNFIDYSSDYCSMDTFYCEGEFERWTIFFGHENE